MIGFSAITTRGDNTFAECQCLTGDQGGIDRRNCNAIGKIRDPLHHQRFVGATGAPAVVLFEQAQGQSRVSRRIDVHFRLGGLVGHVDIDVGKKRRLRQTRAFGVAVLTVIEINYRIRALHQWIHGIRKTGAVGADRGRGGGKRLGVAWVPDIGRSGQVDLARNSAAIGRIFPVVDPASYERGTDRVISLPAKVAIVELVDKYRV